MYRLESGLLAFLLVCLSALVVPSHAEVGNEEETPLVDDLALIEEIAEWAKVNGGTISEKLEVRQIAGSLSGLFAKDDLEQGEIVMTIPWNLILMPASHQADRCDKAENLRQNMDKDPKEQNPYERYLSTRMKDHIPLFWSPESKDILEELMEDFANRGFHKELTARCDGRMLDERFQHAYMLLQTRGEGYYGDLLVPFEDLLNHRNGNHTNVQPEISAGRHVRVVTTRVVRAGEQFQNSYNKCPYCKALFSNPRRPTGFQVTPQLFEEYGFVEDIPQRWVIPEMRMIFDVVYSTADDTGEDEVAVVYAVPPSSRGLHYLRRRLYELALFEEEYGERNDIPDVEVEGIFSLHEAMVDAYSLAIDFSEGDMSEKVWLKEPESWHVETGYQEEPGTDEL